MKENELDLYNTYHTVLRNIGLYTSISLAILGSSRFYINKNVFKLNHIFLVLLSLIFLIYSICINIFVIYDLKLNFENNNLFKKWLYLLKGILIFNILYLIYLFNLIFTFI
jgi:hypothetical protein